MITNNINVYQTGGIITSGVVHAKMPTATMMKSVSQRQLQQITQPITQPIAIKPSAPVALQASVPLEPPAELIQEIPTTLTEQPEEKLQALQASVPLQDYPPAPTPVAYQDAATQTEPIVNEEQITTQRIQLFEKNLLQILVDMFGNDKT